MIESTLSHYRIIAKLGEGGMGVVYEAEDENLRRRVALKLLPPEMASDPERLKRFRREAEAVAALSHPSIVGIHSIEEENGLHFLTMELVKGEPLDAILSRGGLPLAKALRIGELIASALASAHDQGVVHRDLKPANVMLTEDGNVKVLDFGLAKLASDEEAAEGRSTQLMTEVALTGEGAILGTVAYMSPEQAQGRPADRRADVFSLGCLLYEASTGTLPFRGDSSIDTLYQIIHADPRPIDELTRDAPPQLQWILRKALAKEPAERYQSARELAVDLKNLRRDLESDSDRSSEASRPSAVAQPESRRLSRRLVRTLAVAAVALAGIWWFQGRRSGTIEPASRSPATISVRPITSSGKVTCGAISPDGNYVAYVESDQGLQSLNLRQLQGSRNLELIAPRRVGYWGLSFTRDGSAIVFGEKSAEEPTGAFFRISTLGGTARKLLTGIDSQPTFSPDGARMAWVRAKHPTPDTSSLMVADVNGTNARVLAAVSEPERFAPVFYTGPSWSADGDLIAASVVTVGEKAVLKAFRPDTGEVQWIGDHEWEWAAQVAWLPQGDGLLAIASEQSALSVGSSRLSGRQIWFVPYPRGSPVRLTNDLSSYRVLSLSADGRSLVTVPASERTDISVMPRDGSTPPRRISHSRLDGRYGFDFTQDGRIVHQTLEAGRLQIAIMNADGSHRELLTDGSADSLYPWVAEADRVFYGSFSVLGTEIWAMEIDGGNPDLVASVGLSRSADLSPDGKWLVYAADHGGMPALWRKPLAGGPPERLTDYEAEQVAISPDGTRIAYYYRDPATGVPGIGVMPLAPGEPQIRIEAPPRFTGSLLRWAGDGQALLINTLPEDRSNLWRVPLDGGEPERLTQFTDQILFWAEVSPDGKTLALARGELIRDAVLIEGFR